MRRTQRPTPSLPVREGDWIVEAFSVSSLTGRVRVGLFFLLFPFSLSAQEFGRITLLFAGDLMQHQGQIDAARQSDGSYDYTPCFQYVKEEVSRADVAIANLEVTLAGRPYRGYPQFSAPDEYAQAIKEAGFDILLTANNHCLDRRQKGLERTIRVLDSLQIPHAGTYINSDAREKRYPLIIQKNGFRIALLSYTYATNGIEVQAPNVVNYIDREQILADIAKARSMKADVIIACMHWGIEYRLQPERQERQLVDWLIANGVDHVIGGHPHVLQPMEVRSDEYIAARHLVVYSLGNYISNMSVPNTDGGAMVKLELKKIGHIAALADCSYSLVWTSRPSLRGGGNYLLYPAADPPQTINEAEKSRLDRFLKSVRNLFKKSNIGIREYFFE
ncbi:MAG: CapA family protein [Bacteroidaceae bacterium]|nr:CapA family protein [Bacteroidaceae bacterium]